MKFLVLAVMSLSLSTTAFGQRLLGQHWPIGGNGTVLHPGSGHAPSLSPGGAPGHSFSRGLTPPLTANDPKLGPIVIVPLPVYDAGYTDRTPAPTDPNPNWAPGVTFNQNPVLLQESPPTVGDGSQAGTRPCANPQRTALNPQASANEGRPTIYLIAFKDHSVVRALGYWMEAGSLHYVSAEYGLNQVSMVLIDQELSQRLNDERGVAFKFPAPK